MALNCFSSMQRERDEGFVNPLLIALIVVLAAVLPSCNIAERLKDSDPKSLKYSEMNDTERVEYIKMKSVPLAKSLGNKEPGNPSEESALRIKRFVDAYLERDEGKKNDSKDCAPGGDILSIYERASQNAPTINRVFREEGASPEIGLYLAMLASEHCVCYRSERGPVGIFQLSRVFARSNRLTTSRDPNLNDERCDTERASYAVTRFLKSEAEKHPADSLKELKLIMVFHIGPGSFRKHVAARGDEVTGFWKLVSMKPNTDRRWTAKIADLLPRFFAAAIIGENPADFGIQIEPLSTY
ncbi:MAG: hypothetical protein HKN33_19310 [Pyrinomonadaceae bacterium]|nr:hypothetical protein [Pyrinomonadaceae bacterium]